MVVRGENGWSVPACGQRGGGDVAENQSVMTESANSKIGVPRYAGTHSLGLQL